MTGLLQIWLPFLTFLAAASVAVLIVPRRTGTLAPIPSVHEELDALRAAVRSSRG